MRKARWIVVMMVVLLVTALLAVGPAAAKKPVPQPPELTTVTLSFIDGFDGLEAVLDMQTDVDRSGAVVYLADGNEGSSPADLHVRGFEDFLAQGFHPGLALVDPDECGEPLYEGMTWISFDRNGELDNVLWHFDMEVARTARQRGKKTGCDWRVKERYTIRSLDAAELLPGEPGLSYTDGVVSGTFKLHLYDADAAEPHVDLSRTFMQFNLTIGG